MEDLPLEIKKEIVKYLSDKERRKFRLANSGWFKLIKYSNFTLYLTRKSEWKQIVDRLAKYKHPISVRLEKNLMTNRDDVFEHLYRLTNLISCSAQYAVRSNSEGFQSAVGSLTALTNLKAIPFGLSNIPSHILQQLTNLEVLQDHQCAESQDTFSDLLPLLPNLQEVQYHLYGSSFSGIMPYHTKLTRLELIRRLLDLDLPRLDELKHLCFGLSNNSRDEISLTKLTALESLVLNHSNWAGKFVGWESCSRLTSLVISAEILERSDQSSLRTLRGLQELSLLIDEGNHQYLTIFTNLRSLSIEQLRSCENHTLYTTVLGHLRSSSLTYLSMDLQGRTIDAENFSQVISLQKIHLEDARLCGHKNLLLLTNLTKFQWRGWRGETPDGLADYLPEMTSLRDLHYKPCYSNYRDYPEINLSALTKLESLDVFVFAAFRFEHLTNLTSFKLKGFTGEIYAESNLQYLEKMTKLEILEYQLNFSRALQYLSTMTNLRELAFNGARDDEDLLHVTMLTRLTRFSVAEGPALQGHCLTTLTSLQNLFLITTHHNIACHFPLLHRAAPPEWW